MLYTVLYIFCYWEMNIKSALALAQVMEFPYKLILILANDLLELHRI